MYEAGLSANQVAAFRREGMLCLPDFLAPEEVLALVNESKRLLSDFDISSHPMTQFKVDENDHIGDQYFFDSSDKILFFFDTDAFDESGALKYPKEQAINKIGHGLHMKNQVFQKITMDQKVVNVAKSLGYKAARVLQSMCIFKHPVGATNDERENAVPPHTDATFLFTEPQTAVGFWYALEDCTLENGCLWYNPGSQNVFPLTKRFVKVNGGKDGCAMIPLEHNAENVPEDKPKDYVPVECKAGSLILIHNSVLHKSDKNRSHKSRFAYAFHVIDGTSKFDELNWLQVPVSGGCDFTKLYE